jgi:hypothetical protein
LNKRSGRAVDSLGNLRAALRVLQDFDAHFGEPIIRSGHAEPGRSLPFLVV